MKNKKSLYDIILITVLLVITLVSYLLYAGSGKQGDTVIVKLNNDIIGKYDLHINGEYELNGGTNKIVIENGKVYMHDANCPDKLCVQQGKISKANQCITCLPNKITVTVDSNNQEVDLVS